MSITYPSAINTNYKKLAAVCSLLEQMRLEHNHQGAIARATFDANAPPEDDRQIGGSEYNLWLSSDKYLLYSAMKYRWEAYAKKFSDLQQPLLEEQAKLQDAILRANYKESQWAALTVQQKVSATKTLFGDKATLKSLSTKATCTELTSLKAVSL